MPGTIQKHNEPPKADFTRDDYNAYFDRLRPYREKVLGRKETLDQKEVADLERVAAELAESYSHQSLALSGIYASFAILDVSKARLDWARRQTLEDEYAELTGRLGENLSDREQEEIYSQLRRICSILEPDHRW